MTESAGGVLKFLDKFFSGLHRVFAFLALIIFLGVLVFIVSWRIDRLFAKNLGDRTSLTLLEEIHQSGDQIRGLVDSDEKKDQVLVDIPKGTSLEELALLLEEEGVVADSEDLVSRIQEEGLEAYLRPGIYEFDQGASLSSVVTILTQEGVDQAQAQEAQAEAERVHFELPYNASTQEVAQILLDQGLISDAEAFSSLVASQGKDGTFIGGGYSLDPSLSVQEIIDIMTTPQEAPAPEEGES